jgi:methylamine dehydrogenase accessory protein MauD
LQRSRVQAVLLLVAAVILGGYLFWHGGSGSPAPAFSLPEVDAGQVDLDSYSGRPLLLVFWTTSCPICRHELPLLNRMDPEFRSKGISVVTICLGGVDETREYLNTKRIALKTLYDQDGKVGRAYRVSGVPRVVLIDKDGKVKRSSSGWTSEDVLRDWMAAVG